MKKILFIFLMLIATKGYCVDEWAKTMPLGTSLINDIDTLQGTNNEALDRLLSHYRSGLDLHYLSASTLTIEPGEVTCSNAGGTVRKFRANTASTTVTWADIDTGAEASSTDYYVYADCDAATTTATFKISINSSTPTGVTYYERIGSFYNDSSGNITSVDNDDDDDLFASGTVANGGTIPLPGDYLESECAWTVAIGTISHYNGGDGNALQDITATVNSSRVATCTIKDRLAVTASATCNYIIVCHR